MRIKRIISQHRRDFYADYECENCGYMQIDKPGYDDGNFHENVIPKMKCSNCGESANSLKTDYRPLTTKWPDGYQI